MLNENIKCSGRYYTVLDKFKNVLKFLGIKILAGRETGGEMRVMWVFTGKIFASQRFI